MPSTKQWFKDNRAIERLHGWGESGDAAKADAAVAARIRVAKNMGGTGRKGNRPYPKSGQVVYHQEGNNSSRCIGPGLLTGAIALMSSQYKDTQE